MFVGGYRDGAVCLFDIRKRTPTRILCMDDSHRREFGSPAVCHISDTRVGLTCSFINGNVSTLLDPHNCQLVP